MASVINMFDNFDLTKFIFGRLSWESIPFHEPILIVTFAAVLLAGTRRCHWARWRRPPD